MKKRILVVEDEIAINDLICMNLEVAGYEPVPFFDGQVLWEHLQSKEAQAGKKYDLALLDIMLPGRDGFALLEDMRRASIPVIYLTAKDDVASKVRGLKNGAEDYIVKPFEMLELLTRMDKVLERYAVSGSEVIQIRDVMIDVEKRKVTKNGQEVILQPMDFDCLMTFWKYKNRVISREQILNTLWGVDFAGETRTVDVHVGNLRRKLDFADIIITVPRVGYRMEVEV